MSVNELQDGRDEAPLETPPEVKALKEVDKMQFEEEVLSDDLLAAVDSAVPRSGRRAAAKRRGGKPKDPQACLTCRDLTNNLCGTNCNCKDCKCRHVR